MSIEKEIELTEKPAVIYLPENAIELYIEVKIYENGELQKVHRTVSMKELCDAFKDADENYFDPDATYHITEKGKEYLNSLKIN